MQAVSPLQQELDVIRKDETPKKQVASMVVKPMRPVEPEWDENMCPYHLINKTLIKFIQLVERDLLDSHYEAEIRSMRFFKTRAKDLTKRIISMVTWAQLANVHGFGSMYLRIPGVLESWPFLQGR